MNDHDCPNCALAEKLLAVLHEDGSDDFLLYLHALNIATRTILNNIRVEDEDDTEGSA